MSAGIAAAACAVLAAADPFEKVALSRSAVGLWRSGSAVFGSGAVRPPERPARPERPRLLPPRDMPRRRAGFSQAGRVALLHAVAHIELNAIDLAWDLLARFGDGMPRDFLADWVEVAGEEAEHFALVASRLSAFGAAYGDLAAHDGLWEAAEATSSDLLARLAVVPLVLEARGLDVTPAMIERLKRFGDEESAAALELILAQEVGHVAAGARWFRWECARRGWEPAPAYRDLVRRHFKGALKPPFNHAARAAAGLDPAFYETLAGVSGDQSLDAIRGAPCLDQDGERVKLCNQ